LTEAGGLDDRLTLTENLVGHARIRGLSHGEASRRAGVLLERFGMSALASRTARGLSTGERKRVALARALLHQPEVLFLDEPTSGLDPISRRSLWDYLAEVRRTDETTIFLTTHYLEEAEGADRVCVIDHGRIAVIGTPEEMKQRLLERSIEVDALDRPALAADLRSLGLQPTELPDGALRVAFEGPTAQDLISRIGTPLSVLRVSEPSLEEAYVALLRQSEEEAA
ncbi:MAG TPA: ABC transporter ATP-binding protein, partial [Candidatus Limnocylindrales bacterium]|nr:ABC transporter ATP-binding protein [Candidatus Limnocylindrales bacterium]